MAAEIQIYGVIASREVLEGLADAAVTDGVDYIDDLDRDGVLRKISQASAAGVAVCFEGAGSTIFENVVAFCEDNSLSYRREADADDEFSAEIVTFDAATGTKEEFERGHRQRTVVGLDVLAGITDMTELTSLIERMRAIEADIGPIVVPAAPAPAA